MLKIRAIQDLAFEESPQFVCIDEFKEKEGYYRIGLQVYSVFGENVTLCSNNVRHYYEMNKYGQHGLSKHYNDKHLLPDVTMYLRLGEMLKMKGKIFNKKLGKIIERRE